MGDSIVLVDLLFFTGKRGGMETYVKQLMARLDALLPHVSLVAITSRDGFEAVAEFFPGPIHVVPGASQGSIAWAASEILRVPAIAKRLGADLIFAPANVGPWWGQVPVVLTVHDLIYRTHPEPGLRALRSSVVSVLIRGAIRHARHVVTISQASRSALEGFRLMRQAVTVIPNGASEPVTDSVNSDADLPLTVGPDRPVVLSVGNRMPHKNFHGLLRALATMPTEQRPLVVIPGGGDLDPLSGLVHELGLERDVVLPGWVSTKALEALYRRADVYACPSLAEGFGLPVIDAMARGCIVVANDIEVLREVGGDVAMYADATDARQFGEAILNGLRAAEHSDLPSRGLERAKLFTWDKTAELTARVIQMTLSGPRNIT